MKKLIVICAVLVLVQAGLAVLTHVSNHGNDSTADKGPLFPFAAAAVNEMLLEDGEGHHLLLKKEKEQWQLPETAFFPADGFRVQELLDQLVGLQRGWPEATTAEAATRFKVAPDRFERKLTLRKGGADLAVVYFGSSPGLRKIYFRVDKDPEIHALALTQHELEVQPDSWIDTRALRLKPEQVLRIDLPDLRMERKGEELQLVGLASDEEVVKEQQDALVKRLTDLSINSVLGKETKPEYGLEHPVLRYSLALKDGKTVEYLFGQPPTAKDKGAQMPEPASYVLKVSNRDQLFRVDGWQIDAIRKVNRAALVRHKKPASAEQAPPPAAVPSVPAQ